MAAEPGPPSTPSEQPAGEEPAGTHPRSGAPAERYGPLALERHVKADGRALILYSLHSRGGSPPA